MKIIAVLLCLVMMIFGNCLADDLDDGIPIDDSIDKYYKLKLDQNIRFIEIEARSRSMVKKQDIKRMTKGDSDYALQGSVVVEAGAKTGDIVVIYKGNKNTVVNPD